MKLIITIILTSTLLLACGQKKDDSGEVAALAFLIASGALRPARVNTPGGTGDPNGGDGLHQAPGCLIDQVCYDTFMDCAELGGVTAQCH
ncbi:MAG: hypothetical protein K8S54_11100 [Spirochaetia bacterium]|nr:hypothetical protein [Spirochaetia bacterium]